jgi:hypothetical protein
MTGRGCRRLPVEANLVEQRDQLALGFFVISRDRQGDSAGSRWLVPVELRTSGPTFPTKRENRTFVARGHCMRRRRLFRLDRDGPKVGLPVATGRSANM